VGNGTGIGFRLGIDTALAIAILTAVFASGGLWFRVDALADNINKTEGDRLPQRVARIEQTVEYNREKIDDLKKQSEKNHDLLNEILQKVGDD